MRTLILLMALLASTAEAQTPTPNDFYCPGGPHFSGDCTTLQQCPSNYVVGELQLRDAPWADVKAWGAVGDGVADDTAALQAALDSALPVVLLSPGTYRITSTLTLTGANRTVTGVATGASTLTTTLDIPMLQVGTYTYTGTDNWLWNASAIQGPTISHLTFQQTAATHTSGAGIEVRGAWYGMFDDLRFIGTPWGIVVRPISNHNTFRDIQATDGGTPVSAGPTPILGALWIRGDGATASYASVDNRYENIQAMNVRQAGMEWDGPYFTDAVVQGATVWGFGATAGLWMHAALGQVGQRLSLMNILVGGTYTDGVRGDAVRYVSVHGVFDGTCTQVLHFTNSATYEYAYASSCAGTDVRQATAP